MNIRSFFVGARALKFASLASMLIPGSAAALNLVQNSGFEEARGNALPAGWTGYAPHNGATFGTTTSLAKAGTHSATIETTSDQIGILVSEPVPVAPGEELHLSCWMRARDVSTSTGGMLSLSAGFQDRYGSYITWRRKRFDLPTSSGEWFKVESTVTVPERVAKVTLQAGMRFITGCLLVDELEMHSSHTAVARFDLASAQFDPGATTLPLILIDRQPGAKHTYQLTGQPGDTSASVQAIARETSVTLPFTFSKRGKVTARVRLSAQGGGDDFETSVPGTVPALLTADPLIPTHWVLEDKGTAAFEWRVYIAEPEESRRQLSARCVLLDETSHVLASEVTSVPGLNETMLFHLGFGNKAVAKMGRADVVQSTAPAPTQPTTCTARLTITDNKGKVVATAEQPWRFIHEDDTRVTMAEDGFPRVKGKPFFPIGMYMAGNHPGLKEAGFNVLQTYSGGFAVDQGERPNNAGIQQFLDRAESAGMKALVFVNHGLATRLGRDESLRRIRMFRNHPAMLVWYEEEAVARGLKPLSWLEQLVGDMRREGPGHPVLLGDLVDYGVKIKDRSHMLPTDLMDAGIWWWYPTPPRNAPVVEDYEGENAGPALEYVPPAFLVQTETTKPLWIALQCYKKPDTTDARYPSAAEYRCQAYLSLACGAKGLFYYTGYGESGGGVFHHEEEGHWNALKTLVTELRGMEGVWMSPDAEASQRAKSSEKMLTLKTKQVGRKRVVIAVNRCNRVLKPALEIAGVSAGNSVAVLTENRSVEILSTGKLQDEFQPYAVHLYEITE
jgi:hypothetical protein